MSVNEVYKLQIHIAVTLCPYMYVLGVATIAILYPFPNISRAHQEAMCRFSY